MDQTERQLRAQARVANQAAHRADAERADAEAALLKARAETLAAQAREARARAQAAGDRAALQAVRRLCQMTIDASSRVQAVEQARDTLALIDQVADAQQPSVEDGAWGTVWLEGKWRWLTSRMTTEQREYAADCVARWSTRLAKEDNDLERGEPDGLRWWRDDQ